MIEIPLLPEIVALFAAASLVIVLSKRYHVPPVIGYLATGMALGPSGLGVVGDRHDVEVYAELGVVFLLFVVGLHVSLDRLRTLARAMLLGGGAQALLTTGIVVGLGFLLDLPVAFSVFLGFVVLMSSTAIVLKLYAEADELDAPHGQVATAILLFQDLLIVPLMLLVPVLAGAGEGGTGGQAALRFAGGLGIVGVVFAAGRFVVPRLLEAVARSGVREVFVLAGLLSCLGGALLTQTLGLSLVLGAFLAGILIAETDFHHQVVAETGPFRDAFNALFFISIGMLLDLSVVSGRLPLVLGLAAGSLALKAVTLYAVVGILGYAGRVRILVALGLCQIGEFSFVLVQRGGETGLLSPEIHQTAIAVIVVTMVAAPLLIRAAPSLAERLPGAVAGGDVGDAPEDDPLSDHIVVGGYGLNGRHVTRVLASSGHPYVVVDLNARAVAAARGDGHRAIFGDLTRPEIQVSAGVPRAGALVLALTDPLAMADAVRLGRSLAPDLFILARARRVSDLEELNRLGADEVVTEEFEASIEIVTRVLRQLHVPGNVIRAEARLLRAGGYEMLREPTMRTGITDEIAAALAAGTTETFRILPDHFAVDQSLHSLQIRRRCGATAIAVVRNGKSFPNPSPEMALKTGDLLVLVGAHGEIEVAFQLLERGPEELSA